MSMARKFKPLSLYCTNEHREIWDIKGAIAGKTYEELHQNKLLQGFITTLAGMALTKGIGIAKKGHKAAELIE